MRNKKRTYQSNGHHRGHTTKTHKAKTQHKMCLTTRCANKTITQIKYEACYKQKEDYTKKKSKTEMNPGAREGLSTYSSVTYDIDGAVGISQS